MEANNPRELLAQQFEELVRRHKNRGLIADLYPDEGPLARDKYPKHMEVFGLGKAKMARLVAAGNGTGKTFGIGGYEVALHMTGLYPDWWPGHRYGRPVRGWVCGKTMRSTRDNQQKVLIGRPNAERHGGGLIPAECIDFDSLRRLQGGGGAIDYVRIRHASGGWSHMGLRFYDQDVDAFYGENLDLAWMDEPPPAGKDVEIYSEIVARFRGSPYPMVIVTFTPKKGATPLTMLFTDEDDDSRAVTYISWDEVPHLEEKWKKETRANTPKHMRETVEHGVPAMAEGAVYPVPQDKFVIDPLSSIPDHWPRIMGFDGGWHNTAAVWAAWDRDSDVVYIYSEHLANETVVPLIASAIKARGNWIPKVGDADSVSQNDGEKMRKLYAAEGVVMRKPDKAVDAGIQTVLSRLLSGRLKIYSTCTGLLKEFRTYKYKDGKVHKTNDHHLDALRYLCFNGLKYAKTEMDVKALTAGPRMKEITFGRRY